MRWFDCSAQARRHHYMVDGAAFGSPLLLFAIHLELGRFRR